MVEKDCKESNQYSFLTAFIDVGLSLFFIGTLQCWFGCACVEGCPTGHFFFLCVCVCVCVCVVAIFISE